MQGARVQSLVGELRSRMPKGAAGKKKKMDRESATADGRQAQRSVVFKGRDRHSREVGRAGSPRAVCAVCRG